MKSVWLDKKICYDGTMMRSHWIFSETGILGNAIASFIGPADVELSNMVDIVDVKNKEPIFSRSMLHFIAEHFDGDLKLAIARQRLLAAIVCEELRTKSVCQTILRRGDDIYDGEFKMSVSIATSSPVSFCIHFGINIESEGTPVPTKGLNDLKIEPRAFGEMVSRRWCEEISAMEEARCKVRAVL